MLLGQPDLTRSNTSALASRTLPPRTGFLLGPRDLSGLLEVVLEVGSAKDIADFRRRALEGLSRFLGYRHSLFMVGPNPGEAVRDTTALAYGLPASARDFVGHLGRLELWRTPAAASLFRHRPVVGLSELTALGAGRDLPRLQGLLASYGFRSLLLVRVPYHPDLTVVVAVLTPSRDGFGPRDRAVLTAAAGHFGGILRLLAPRGFGYPLLAPELTNRQREVVRLVAQGLNNREIAQVMDLSEYTVKRHISAALGATRRTGRTQLAVDWLREHGQDRRTWVAG